VPAILNQRRSIYRAWVSRNLYQGVVVLLFQRIECQVRQVFGAVHELGRRDSSSVTVIVTGFRS